MGMRQTADIFVTLVADMKVLEDDVETTVEVTISEPEYHEVLKVWYCRIIAPGLIEGDEIVMGEGYEETFQAAISFLESYGEVGTRGWSVPKSQLHYRSRSELPHPVPPPMVFIDRVDRLIVPDFAGVSDNFHLIVENQNSGFGVINENGVADFKVQIL